MHRALLALLPLTASLAAPADLLEKLEGRMHDLAAHERFEEAALARDRLRSLAESLWRLRVDRWLTDSGNEQGYVMDLATLWRLAEHWYEGRLDTPYTRRDPQTAAAYFRSVGLDGPFWGLD